METKELEKLIDFHAGKLFHQRWLEGPETICLEERTVEALEELKEKLEDEKRR